MTAPRDEAVAALIARLSAGEAVSADTLPDAVRSDPEVARLLRLARVMGQLDHNAERGALSPSAPERIGAYRILRLLGSGGMGDVWLGERADGTVEHQVAIKRVRGTLGAFAQRLESERRILARLSHPNIARFVDAGVDERGSPWLALEYVDGVAIAEWCERRRLGLAARIELFRKVCAAVEHAHRHLVVHRDIKPSNVLVDADGEPKLLDFGIAKLLDGSAAELTGALLTPAYAAPEQLRGGEVSTATDVYALGLLLFRLLAGALPETRHDASVANVLARLDDEETQRPSQRAMAHAAELPYPPLALRGDLDAIVAQAIRAQPEARYGTVGELSADLGRYLGARPVVARAPTGWYRFSRFARRNRVALALGSLAGVALVSGIVISLQQARRAEREAEGARRELARAERVSAFLGSLYREHDPLNRGASTTRSPAAVMADGVARVARELGDDPLSQAQLLRVLGEAQINLGELAAAHRTLELAEKTAESARAPTLSVEVLVLRGALAMRESRIEDADRLFADAHARALALSGAEGIDAARVDAQRALSLVWTGRFKDALAAANSSYRVLRDRLGAQAPETLSAQITLGATQEQLRDDAAAQASLRAAIAGLEVNFGETDARLVWPLQSLGEVLRRQRDFAAARGFLARGTRIARAQFGERSVQLANILLRQATVERDAGALDAAVGFLDEAERALPEGELSGRAQLLATRGGTFIESGDGVRAEADLREALRLRRDTGGLSTGLAWFTQAQVGEALALQGRFADAHRLQSEAALELRKLLGPDAYQNALIAMRWAKTFDREGDWPGAVLQWREAARLVEKTYGQEHFGSFEQRLALAHSLSKYPAGRAEAADIADELLARWAGNPAIRASYADLVLLRCSLHRDPAEARRLAADALAQSDLQADEKQRVALRGYAAAR
jgi:serine/threonine-protein kinase